MALAFPLSEKKATGVQRGGGDLSYVWQAHCACCAEDGLLGWTGQEAFSGPGVRHTWLRAVAVEVARGSLVLGLFPKRI